MFSSSSKGIILGSTGGIGSALNQELRGRFGIKEIICPDRLDSSFLDENWWNSFSKEVGDIDFFINCIGVLNHPPHPPEKSIDKISLQNLQTTFETNSFIPALSMKYMKKNFSRKSPSLMVHLSAMLGSIGDNNLGGWYSYRSSKTALNMLVKNFSLEMKRLYPEHISITQHPGTTLTKMTENYIRNVKHDVKTPLECAEILIDLWNSLNSARSGSFLNWSGENIKW